MARNHSYHARDFDAATRRALLEKGIVILGSTLIDGPGPMPLATASPGYCLSVRGTHMIKDRAGVLKLAQPAVDTQKEFIGPWHRCAIACQGGEWLVYDAESRAADLVVARVATEEQARDYVAYLLGDEVEVELA